ncbi:MAG: twin-arginine translocase subunit TatC [Nitriliruptorales bacterium]
MSSRTAGEMTLAEHLAELRSRVIRIVTAVAVGAIVGWFFSDAVIGLLKRPYCDLPGAFRPDGECALIVTRPLEGFGVRVKVSLVIGLFLAAGMLFHQLWRFVSPGLTARERRYTLPFVVLSQVMFAAGAAFAFFVMPKALRVLIELAGEQVAALLSAGEYVSFILSMVVAFGLVFEVPLVVVFLVVIELLNRRQLQRFRPYAIVANFVIAALVTPTVDAVTMLLMAGPMVALYEASILAAWFIERSRARRSRTAEETG